MRVPIPEVEQINLIVNNSNPYLRTWLYLTGMPVTFVELYSRGRSIQAQLRDPSFQLYLPRPKKKEPVPTTEGTTSNEQVTTMSTYSRPAQGAQRSSQPPRLLNQPVVPEAFKPQANAGPAQAPPPQLQIQAPPPQPQVQNPQVKPQYNNLLPPGNYTPKRLIGPKRQSYPPLPQSLRDIFQIFMAYNTLCLPKERESWPAYVD